VNPISAANAANVNITITGADFQSPNPVAYLVDGGTTALATTYVSPNVLNAVIPAWFTANYYDLRVTNPDAQSDTLTNAFTLTNPTPLIAGVDPHTGVNTGTTDITIHGSNFVNGLSASLDGLALALTFVDSATLNATVPGDMPGGFYTLTVSNPGPLNPTGERPDAFTATVAYGGPPTCYGVSNCSDAEGPPDGGTAGIPEGGYLTFTLPPGSGISDGPGYDFVFFEYPNPDNPTGGIQLDWIVAEISDDGATWQQVFNWGNGAADTNSNVSAYAAGGEFDGEFIPTGDLWPGLGAGHPNTGIAIDISIIGPPPGSQYRYVRFSCPDDGPGNDEAQIDAILRLH
jgi:hypothetical protein